MRKEILATVFLIVSQITFGQIIPSKIDSINSKEEVQKLIRSFGKDYETFVLKNINQFKNVFGKSTFCKRTADSLGITQPFYKSDFDNNGLIDLLAIGYYYDFCIFIVMNYGRDSLKLQRLTRRSFQDCTFPKIYNDTIIRYYYMPDADWREKKQPSLQQKNLIFKFGDFVEYNPSPKNYNIEKVEYQTTECYGTCPVFYISIDKNNTGLFKAEAYNDETRNSKEVKGTFKTIVTEKSYSEIINLLNYIDFPNLKDDYAVNWTDDQTCTLKITYNNGQVKTITDYGLIGTYGLDRLYQLLFDLRFNQKWE